MSRPDKRAARFGAGAPDMEFRRLHASETRKFVRLFHMPESTFAATITPWQRDLIQAILAIPQATLMTLPHRRYW